MYLEEVLVGNHKQYIVIDSDHYTVGSFGSRSDAVNWLNDYYNTGKKPQTIEEKRQKKLELRKKKSENLKNLYK